MFCPKCRSEFEPGYIHCDACDADLVESLPVDEDEYSDHMTRFEGEKECSDLVTVFEGNEGLADLVCAKLRSLGIDARVRTDLAARVIISPDVDRSTVQVRSQDAAAARKALEEGIPLDEDRASDFGEDSEDEA